MQIHEFKEKLNTWGRARVPFLFVVDFELEKPLVWKLEDINPNDIRFDVNGFTNCRDVIRTGSIPIHAAPISFLEYKAKFDTVYNHLAYGDSYLTNLTIATQIELENTLLEIYKMSSARFKFFYKDEFLVFSPEGFIKIHDNKIYSFPMKGTIDASIPDAAQLIVDNRKEMAEHITIVDLIRNDLSIIAKNVRVNKFRYLEEIKTNKKKLLQVSSEISADLDDDWRDKIGNILISLLPAGSISGAPKEKTCSIISEVEKTKRGYYTGVFGYFDGQQVDSGVMIRYIEKKNNLYLYRSGGGITTQSDAAQEYQEIIDKVYVPIT